MPHILIDILVLLNYKWSKYLQVFKNQKQMRQRVKVIYIL